MLSKGRRTPIRLDHGGFRAFPTMPGWVDPRSRDHGLGPLAMIVRSELDPGRLIAMHEHRNDEIISWVPAGVMRHDDRLNGKLLIDAGHLMVMNAGHSFWHSEETLASDPALDMLQIFVRPQDTDLEPMIQYGPLAPSLPNHWRHLFGPKGGQAPFFVRNQVDCYDLAFDTGARLAFPSQPGRDLYFYLFRGTIRAEGIAFACGEQGLLRGGGPLELEALTAGTLVVFLVDCSAKVTRCGTVGDNRRIPPVILFRALSLWDRLRPRHDHRAHPCTPRLPTWLRPRESCNRLRQDP